MHVEGSKPVIAKVRYDYVKRQIDCMDYIMQHVKLKKVGNLYQGRCPFHNEKTGSFTVFPVGHGGQKHSSFYCFGCGVGGDVIEFKRLQEGVPTQADALLILEKELGIEAEDEELQYNLLKEQLDSMRHTEEQVLELSEINLMCSSICRNYLLWVKENHPKFHQDEIEAIEKFYRFLDVQMLKLSASEAMYLAEDTQERLARRKSRLMILEEGDKDGYL